MQINLITQTDSGGKVNILEDYSISHCEKNKVHMNMCLILNGYQERIVWIYNKKTVWMVIKREKLLVVNFTLILSLNDKFDRQKWQICYSSQ
jgi:hypothetical protein